MWTKLFGLAAAAGVIVLSGTAPALALCNPGTPHCIRESTELANTKKLVHQGDGNFNCEPGPDGGICSDDLPGSNAPHDPTHVTPKAGSGTIAVTPR
jgi:hypothetical protein